MQSDMNFGHCQNSTIKVLFSHHTLLQIHIVMVNKYIYARITKSMAENEKQTKSSTPA